MFRVMFDDKRVITALVGVWTLLSSLVFFFIMLADGSSFLSFGPNTRTKLMGVTLNTWGRWWCVAIYTFVSTSLAAFASDAVVPWITNTVQDHKTKYIPYSKVTCLVIIQVFTVYAVIMSVIGMFVALTQIDFMIIRIIADLIVNHYTTYWFLRQKETDPLRYQELQELKECVQDQSVRVEVCEKCRCCKTSTERDKCLKLLTCGPPASDQFNDEL